MPLVVCIGNELVADDAVGFEVHARLARVLPPEARLEYCGVGGIALLDLLDGTDEAMVVVDAMCLGAAIGTVHCMGLDDIPGSGSSAISAHGIGLRETMEIGMALYPERMPKQVTLVGIEGRCFDLPREYMSKEVAAALDGAMERVLSLLRLGNPMKPLAGLA
ncbi:MAG: hydrogenase maturation protease [Proteobacteria bacterium]|nr:hydrogenase maturation protease [Pseudomonadota bacterium]